MTAGLVAAVDLGASSGRVMVGRVGPDTLELTEIRRFPNDPVRLPDGLHWDILRLYHEVLGGLREIARAGDSPVSIGVDSWGVDHGLLDEEGRLLGEPYHYRDDRTAAAVEPVHEVVSRAELYARTGLQFLPFNTDLPAGSGSRARLRSRRRERCCSSPTCSATGCRASASTEVTNASTTSLLDVHRRTWDTDLIESLSIPATLFAPLRAPGDVIGPLRDDVRQRDRPLVRDGPDPRRVARHRVGGRRRAGRRRPVRVHRLRDVVAGRRRARPRRS